MGWAYAGETGVLSGIAWAMLVNYQEARPWFRKPWLHAFGAAVGYIGCTYAASWEDRVLKNIITTYERKGYQIPEDRKALFEPQAYK